MKQHSKKKTGWVNVYKNYDDTPIVGEVYDIREEFISIANKPLTYLDTIKIEWEK